MLRGNSENTASPEIPLGEQTSTDPEPLDVTKQLQRAAKKKADNRESVLRHRARAKADRQIAKGFEDDAVKYGQLQVRLKPRIGMQKVSLSSGVSGTLDFGIPGEGAWVSNEAYVRIARQMLNEPTLPDKARDHFQKRVEDLEQNSESSDDDSLDDTYNELPPPRFTQEEQREWARKGAKAGGKATYENGTGIFKGTKQQRLARAKTGGKATRDSGRGLFKGSKQQQRELAREAGRKGGKVAREKSKQRREDPLAGPAPDSDYDTAGSPE